ncbi:transcriptional regulator, lysR family [Vibrio ishigakensis]|uniref:Transcriptional regulator, lysR family n=1 Tax=Vibrio ishigakensis TaxID=1481914 RepID=A0A0B8NJ14_9VIBR|nr:LysR substrate-binding domain-containing protein [Vibrio ishigakensis]GAM54156.1 transcriptional regulator, lysR family [Vibrio ishigakensis]
MDKFKAIETFVAVCDQGSFTKAADKLDISVTMVSKSIAALEQQLKLKILNRNTRKQSLTQAGELYLKSCRELLSDLEATEKKLESLAISAEGQIRISAPTNFGSYVLAPLLSEFSKAHSDIRIELELSDQVSDVIQDRFDFYFRVGQLPDSELIAIQVAQQKMVFAASPTYLKQFGEPTSLDQLQSHKVLGFTPWFSGSSFGKEFDLASLNLGHSKLVSNNGNSLRILAIQGSGIALQPYSMLREDIDSGALVGLLSEVEVPTRPVFLLYHSRELLPARIKAFIEFIKQSRL